MKSPWISNEGISFQKNKKFFEELTAIIVKVRQIPEKDLSNHEILQDLQKVILKYSGINVNVICIQDSNGIRISLPMMTPNHVLLSTTRQMFSNSTDLIKLMGPTDKSIKAFANPATGMVGGAFSEMVHTLHLPSNEVLPNLFTEKEISAIILHELGHIWNYFYYFAATVRSSAIFEYINRELHDEMDEKQRTFVISTVGRAASMSESEIKDLTQAKSKEVLQMVIVSNIAEQCRSDIGENIFDHTTWEALSDEYAVRMGAGTELAVALDKMHRRGLSRSHRGWTMYMLVEVIKFALMITPGMTFFGVMLVIMDASSEYHDDPEARFRRIRNQLVQRSKEKDLSSEERKNHLQDIDTMDVLLDSVKDRRQFVSVLAEAIVPSLRKQKNVLEKIRLLENLATNELFVISQQLRNEAKSI